MKYLKIIIASVLLGTSGVFVRLLQAYDINAWNQTFFKSVFCVIWCFLFLKLKRQSVKIEKQQVFPLILFGVTGTGITGLLIIGASFYMPIGLATMLHFIYPLLVVLITSALFKERIPLKTILACSFAVAGMALMNGGGEFSIKGIIMAILSAFTYAIYIIALDKSSIRDMDPLCLIAYSLLFFSLVTAVISIPFDLLVLPTSLSEVFITAISALVSQLIPFALIASEVKNIGATKAAFINMLEPISAIIFGYILFSENINAKCLLGIIFVLCSTAIIIKNKPAENRVECN